jgi:DNA polymerase-3 subunit epsilon
MSKKDPKDLDLCFIDCETTGVTPGEHDIIEICVIRTTQDLKIKRKFCSLVRPLNWSFNDEAMTKNNISYTELSFNAPTFKQIYGKLYDVINNTILVGHNVAFDIRFLSDSLNKIQEKLDMVHYHSIDTASMAWPLFVAGKIKSVSLAVLCDYYGISNENSHRAEKDVERLIQVYQKLLSI